MKQAMTGWRRVSLLVVLLSLSWTAGAATALAGELRHATILQQPGILCDGYIPQPGTTHATTWTNPEPGPIYLRTLYLSYGVSYQGVADFAIGVYKTGDPHAIEYVGGTTSPFETSGHTFSFNFAPDYILLPAGGSLTITFICGWWRTFEPQPYGGGLAIVGYTMVQP